MHIPTTIYALASMPCVDAISDIMLVNVVHACRYRHLPAEVYHEQSKLHPLIATRADLTDSRVRGWALLSKTLVALVHIADSIARA